LSFSEKNLDLQTLQSGIQLILDDMYSCNSYT